MTHPVVAAPGHTGLHLSISGAVTVDATSSIDVTGRGCATGERWDTTSNPPGCTTSGASDGYSGGSYGGLGGASSGGTPNVTYGDPQNPSEPGSGGNTHQYNSASGGGGLVRLTASSLTLNGAIKANGPTQFVGAGSGGGIYINAGTLSGSGVLEANGGTSTGTSPGPYGAGGGGRIAFSVTTNTFSGTTSVTGGAGNLSGTAGTVYP